MSKYIAIGDSVIISVPEVEKVSQRDSGLILVEKDPAGKTTVIGTVISIGEGKFDSTKGTYITPPLTVGDKVILSLSTGLELDKGVRMVKIDDIFAKVI